MKLNSILGIYPLLSLLFIIILSSCSKSDLSNSPTDTGKVTDKDGNVYKTVTIGTQVWMTENLKTTKYKDGTAIPLVTDNTAWANLVTPGYCWYVNDPTTYKNPYGALYNWHTVNTGKLCPTGWHVPTDDELTILTNQWGGNVIAGGKLKEVGITHWINPNIGATNESGFTAVGGGYRYPTNGAFLDIGDTGVIWSSTVLSGTQVWSMDLHCYNSGVARNDHNKLYGFSVRCIKD